VLPETRRLASARGIGQTSRSVHALGERTRKDGTSTVAVKLRLMRMGKKKQPTYRVVAADSRSPRDGRFIEIVGVYAPRGRSAADSAAVIAIDDAKAIRWLSQGAQPTERVNRLFQQSGTWERFRNPTSPDASTPSETSSSVIVTDSSGAARTDHSSVDAVENGADGAADVGTEVVAPGTTSDAPASTSDAGASLDAGGEAGSS